MNPLYCEKKQSNGKKMKENGKNFTICSLPNLYAVSKKTRNQPRTQRNQAVHPHDVLLTLSGDELHSQKIF